MNHRDPEAQRLLERITTGEIGIDHPSVQALMAKDQIFRQDVMDMQDLQHALDTAARAEREALEGSNVPELRADLVAATIGRLAQQPPRRRGWVIGLGLAAVAAGAALVWGLFRDGPPALPKVDRIGSEKLELLTPIPDGHELVLRCRSNLGNATFSGSIFAADDSARRAVVSLDETKEPTWRISREELQALDPARHWRWRVMVRGGGVETAQEADLPLR
jgi:hypothetical protein